MRNYQNLLHVHTVSHTAHELTVGDTVDSHVVTASRV
jgi:hypothetical protein